LALLFPKDRESLGRQTIALPQTECATTQIMSRTRLRCKLKLHSAPRTLISFAALASVFVAWASGS
jgi:hypothetical protein